jgi:2-polyprenyl-6-methoxyphenol hydroxylase-like FAD-dependent oxidoreductase
VSDDAEVVIVGAGVAGASMAIVLARLGVSVLMLEKSAVHVDRIRGESITPWGVEEAQNLGVLDILTNAGGHFTSRLVLYGEDISPESARSRAINLSALVPNVPGTLKIGHPRMCQALNEGAVSAGATLLRGIDNLEVTADTTPSVRFIHRDQLHELRPRLVIGADGRGSAIARQIGADVQTDAVHHLFAGLLVERIEEWPLDEYAIGTEGDGTFFIFPQGTNRMRFYLGYALDQRRRFTGPHGVQNFLNAFRLSSVPQGQMLANARPAGPCQGYPNADTWIDRPLAAGVVLIGDAAGHNDPTIGQGVSIAFRDVRVVRDLLTASTRWDRNIFIPYADERRERMRRLRTTAKEFSKFRCEYTEEARNRRRRAFDRIAKDPSLALPFLVPLKGPSALPDYVYESAAWKPMSA